MEQTNGGVCSKRAALGLCGLVLLIIGVTGADAHELADPSQTGKIVESVRASEPDQAGLLAIDSNKSDRPLSEDLAHEAIRQTLQGSLPGVEVEWIRPAPVPGLYAVKMGQSLVYMDPSGRYLFSGGIFDLEAQVNLTATTLGRETAGRLWTASLADLAIPLGEAAEPGQELVVFDDLDCPFCQREHAELERLAASGWRVWVLLYPVARLHPQATPKSIAIWCASDRQAALLDAWADTPVEERTCPHPLDTIQALARQIGVAGTPTLVLQRGLVLSGYQSAEDIVRQHRQLDMLVAHP